MSIVKVIVTWFASKAIILPKSKQYITVAKFEEDKYKWEKEAWSVVLEFEVIPSEQGNPSYGTARFLTQNAPLERLKSGKIFELYEGRVKVAKVEVL